MADKFFTNPNNKKRKRTTSVVPKSKSKSGAGFDKSNSNKKEKEEELDDEIPSDSDDMADEIDNGSDDGESLDGVDSDDEDEKETAADKRRRLAKQYLENIQQEMAEVEGFDAADLDREIISSRLQQDIAEEQGSVYKFVSKNLASLSNIRPQFNHLKSYGVNNISVHYPYAYSVTKDLYLAKWDITNCTTKNQRPKLIKYVRGNYRISKTDETYNGHVDEILCVAASPDGKHVATAGKDKRIVVWTSENLAPVKAIPIKVGNKSVTVTGLTFRRGAHNGADLYASCSDLIVRIFNIHHLAQTETLFGHQDAVADISALGQERCLTVGSRDRTALLWKINDETRLTFRGGDSEKIIKKVREAKEYGQDEENSDPLLEDIMLEGSIDKCAMIDDSHFLTGSDNGNISLWNVTRRRPLAVVREAHGKDNALTPQQASAETSKDVKVEIPPRIPRAITSLTAVPFSDLFFSGSWDGTIKIWKLTHDLKSFELAGEVKVPGYDGSAPSNDASKDDASTSGSQGSNTKKTKVKKNKKHNSNLPGLGVINDISIAEYGPKGKEQYTVVAAVSKELKNGRWIKIKNGKNGILTFNLPQKK